MESFDPKDLSLPSIDIPTVDLNSLKSFTIDIPQIDASALKGVDLNSLKSLTANVPQIDKVDETILVPAVALVGVFFIVGALGGGKRGDDTSGGDGTSGVSKRAKTKKATQLLAIPYDAAARLAYEEWLMKHDGKYNVEGYQVFQQKYDSMAVAESTYKKLVRELQAFENKAPPPTPPRRIVPKKTPQTTEKSPFFFAEE